MELSSASLESSYNSISDSSTSDDEEDLVIRTICLYGIEAREERVFRTRLIWQDHVDMLLQENKFQRTYRMPHRSFVRLVDMLRPGIQID